MDDAFAETNSANLQSMNDSISIDDYGEIVTGFGCITASGQNDHEQNYNGGKSNFFISHTA